MPFVLLDAPALTAELVASGEPPPVRLILTGVSAGQVVEIRGTVAGSSWSVPGGSLVSSGDQVVLIDNRAPVNTPIVYEAVVDGETFASAPLVVPFSGGAYLLQSLDGRSRVEFVWLDDGLPAAPRIRVVTFDVPGRARPPVRFVGGGDGGGSVTVRTTQASSRALVELLKAGRPLVVRTDGSCRDLPGSDILVFVDASSVLWGGDGGVSDQRVWSMSFLLVDDPEPSTVLGAWTWDDFDAAWAGSTWDDFDAFFAGSTWDDFDTTDWPEVAP